MVKEIERREKTYVSVVARHLEDGTVMPLSVIWEDGREYKIGKVLDWRRAESLKVGGFGMRYLVRVKGKETFLFYEAPRWFVEKKVFFEVPRESQSVEDNGRSFGKRA